MATRRAAPRLAHTKNMENINAGQQEHLTIERLRQITSSKYDSEQLLISRPKYNLVELMNWAVETFRHDLKDQKGLQKMIHNRIIMDGQFMQFCDEKKIMIDCLIKDSAISWAIGDKNEEQYEKFFMQGAFLIKSQEAEFIQCSLFYKGANADDEIAFFVIVANGQYDAYIKLRNDFDAWCKERDRGSMLVRVFDGEDIPYERNSSWDDIFLEEHTKQDIRNTVESFLASKDFYAKNKIPWKRGLIFHGVPGCHAKGTPILMYNGSWKNAEDIKAGEFLMGPDSQPREVLQLVRGQEEMFKITPVKGKPFIVNGNHILHLARSSNVLNTIPEYINISVNDYLSISKCSQQRLKLVHTLPIEFGNTKPILPLDPYILGIWLGDGTSSKPEFTSMDKPIIDEIEKFAHKHNLDCKIRNNTNSQAKTINLSSKPGSMKGIAKKALKTVGVNAFTRMLRELKLLNNKHIPEQYLHASLADRRELLAGIIDTDGSYSAYSWRKSEKTKKKGRGHKGVFDIIQKDLNISRQIGYLAQSLGLGFTIAECIKTIKSINFSGTYYRMTIYGDIKTIPTRLARKKATAGRPNKDPRRTGIKLVENIGIDNYYGFVVDKDHLYVMDDFLITHNCGKTSIIRTIMSNYNFKPVTVVADATEAMVRDAFSYAEDQSPSLLYFEDLDSLLDRSLNAAAFLNLMDGVSAKDGLLVIATANNIHRLKSNITDRPSRFDRKWEIPLPNEKMTLAYLKKWFGSLINEKQYKELVQIALRNRFTFAYLKEVYISSMFEALAHNRKVPTNKDIHTAIGRLLKDKSSIQQGTISLDKYIQ